jgi:copper chaperone
MSTTTYRVLGMTCSHCVNAVTEEVSKIAGVTTVDVDLSTGYVDIESEVPVSDAAVREAVDEAGYELEAS